MNNKETPTPQNLVTLIQNKRIYLENITNQVISAIKDIGAYQGDVADELVWLINYEDDKELASKLHELNILEFLFVGEPSGWPPAEIFENARQKKLLKDSFKEVRWQGPSEWFIIER